MSLANFGDLNLKDSTSKNYHVDFVYYEAVASNSFSIVTALTASLQLALAHTKGQFHHFQIEVIIRPGYIIPYIDEFH